MKNDNLMIWVLGAAVAWYLWRQGTFDQFLGAVLPPPPASGEIVDTAAGEDGVDGGVAGIGAFAAKRTLYY